MDDFVQNPKVFISYAWGKYSDFVSTLASELVNDGIDTVFDKWDLKEGQDKYVFMEQCVKDPDINKVLIICDKTYTEKANNREGGVGNETTIISPEVYGDAQQTKFIPIIVEYDDYGQPYLPVYLETRKYIDFSSDVNYKEAYQDLLKVIYEKPLYERPKLGKKPEWLKMDDENLLCNNNASLDHLIKYFNEGIQKCNIIEIMRNNPIEGFPRDYVFDMEVFCNEMQQKLNSNILFQKENIYINIQEFCNWLDYYNTYLSKRLISAGNDFYTIESSVSKEQMQIDTDDIKQHMNECYKVINSGCSIL